jgi:hypothetical protein
MIKGDFSFIENQARLRTLKILAVFTTGSATGLVTLSHLLGYVLKHYKHITSAVIIGFITGSLGVVWPWKNAVYIKDETGKIAIDSNGDKIIMNYERYIPDFSISETWWAIMFIALGIGLLIGLEKYGKNRTKNT